MYIQDIYVSQKGTVILRDEFGVHLFNRVSGEVKMLDKADSSRKDERNRILGYKDEVFYLSYRNDIVKVMALKID